MEKARHFASSTIKVGCLEIPVKLYTAISEDKGVSLRRLHGADCGRALEQIMICPEHGEIPEDEQSKGYEVAPKRFLELSKAEVDALFEAKPPEIQIQCFIPPTGVPAKLLERIYYLGAEEKMGDGYALFCRALGKKVAAFGRSVVRHREHLALILAEGDHLILWHVAHAARLRAIEDVPSSLSTVRPNHLRLMNALVDRLWDDAFDVGRYVDDEKQKLVAVLKERGLGRPITVAPEVADPGRPILDIGEALERSLSQPARALRR